LGLRDCLAPAAEVARAKRPVVRELVSVRRCQQRLRRVRGVLVRDPETTGRLEAVFVEKCRLADAIRLRDGVEHR
jgi:hypothetical protein